MFEKLRLKSEKSEDASEDKGIDVPMEFLYDLNHVISLHLESADEPLHLVPTTRISDMILMHDSCMQCKSYHGAYWRPDWDDPVGGANVAMTSKSFVYVYLEH